MTHERLIQYIHEIPKAELHIHIEGSLEPELMFEIGRRNNIAMPYDSVESLQKAYSFRNLQDFLDIYYKGADVLLLQQDFYDLTMAYLRKAHADNVLHTEIFFDPQTHTQRSVEFDVVVSGITQAMSQAKAEFGISANLIVCFLRHLSEESAMETLQSALKHKDKIIGVGLDSSEKGNPPNKFFNVFRKACEEGFRLVAHAGEEGRAEYIWEALELLEAERIDHGVRCIDDADLMEELRERQTPLTVCPLSNLKLQVVDKLEELPIKTFLENELIITLNSDDPAYFGGYVNENYVQTAKVHHLSRKEIYTLAKNSFLASFLTENEKKNCLEKLAEFDNHYDEFVIKNTHFIAN